MRYKTKIDEIVKICINWNNKKINAKESMLKIFKINQKYILSELNAKDNPRKCKWCGNKLPPNRITYCNKDCMNNDKLAVLGGIKKDG